MAILEYQAAGSGDNLLVLIHGFPLTSAMWRHQLHALASDEWHVVAPDLPGFGRTPGSAASIDSYADDVRDLLDRLEAEHP